VKTRAWKELCVLYSERVTADVVGMIEETAEARAAPRRP
jgi:hypothetical protein